MKTLQLLTIFSFLVVTWSILRLSDVSDCIESQSFNRVIFEVKTPNFSIFSQCDYSRIFRLKKKTPSNFNEIKDILSEVDRFESFFLRYQYNYKINSQSLIFHKNGEKNYEIQPNYLYVNQDFFNKVKWLPLLIKSRIVALNGLLTYDKRKLNLYSQFYAYLLNENFKSSDYGLANLLVNYYESLNPNEKIKLLDSISKSMSPSFKPFVLKSHFKVSLVTDNTSSELNLVENSHIELESFLSEIKNDPNFKLKKQFITKNISDIKSHSKTLFFVDNYFLSKDQSIKYIHVNMNSDIESDIEKSNLETKTKFEKVVFLTCSPPKFSDLLNIKKYKISKPIWIKNCPQININGSSFKPLDPLLLKNPKLYVELNKKVSFVEYHIPSIETAQKYNMINLSQSINLSKQSKSGFLKKVVTNKETLISKPLSDLEIVTSFREI